MAKRDTAPIGAPCWIDLFTDDPDRTRAFYGEIFGWTSESAGDEYGGYINFSKDGVPVAGAMRNDGSTGAPDTWSVYLATKDAAATVDAASAHGGQVDLPPMQLERMKAEILEVVARYCEIDTEESVEFRLNRDEGQVSLITCVPVRRVTVRD